MSRLKKKNSPSYNKDEHTEHEKKESTSHSKNPKETKIHEEENKNLSKEESFKKQIHEEKTKKHESQKEDHEEKIKKHESHEEHKKQETVEVKSHQTSNIHKTINQEKSEDEAIFEKELEEKGKENVKSISFLGTRRIIENWDTNKGGKIGTVIGGFTLGSTGAGLGSFIASTPMLAAIGTMILPGIGTTLLPIAGGAIGMVISGFGGALIGSEIGKSLDPNKEFVDYKEIDQVSNEIVEDLSKLTNTSTFISGLEDIVRISFNRYSKGEEKMPIEKLREICQDLGQYIDDSELETLVKELDDNNDGYLQFDEFYKWYGNNDKFHKFEGAIKTARRISEIFKFYDKDGAGYLSKKEFKIFYKEFVLMEDIKNPLSAKSVFQIVDKNNDGKVSFNEFVDFEMKFKKKLINLEKK